MKENKAISSTSTNTNTNLFSLSLFFSTLPAFVFLITSAYMHYTHKPILFYYNIQHGNQFYFLFNFIILYFSLPLLFSLCILFVYAQYHPSPAMPPAFLSSLKIHPTMSSLSQQLKAISERNASVALDRKTRSKIHSRSLIFDAKVAAAQDYDYIYEIGCEGLDELRNVDSRFDKFAESLFSESSVTFDRNVQTKDIMDLVNANLEAFINMVAAYYHLNPALKAMEWLVRRYHVNIHNAELLLLSVLPYHSQGVFGRFMNVIPKSSWPSVFASISAYKEQMKPPPASSMLKCFHNDPQFFRLYSEYVVAQMKNKTVYKEMLVFYLANTVQVLASHARDVETLNSSYLPAVLAAQAEFFTNHTFKYLATLEADVKLTAYAIISVLCTIIPLSDELVFSLTQSIVSSPLAFLVLRRQSVIVLGQLWNYYNEEDVAKNAFDNLSAATLLQDEALLQTLRDEKYNLDKFLMFYFLNGANQNDAQAIGVLKHMDFSSDYVFERVVTRLFALVQLCPAAREGSVGVFDRLLKLNREKVVSALDSLSKNLGDLEMVLMHTFSGADVTDSAYEADYEDVELADDRAQSLDEIFSACKVENADFLVSSGDFDRISLVLLNTLRSTSASEQSATVFSFLKIAFAHAEGAVSFLLRLALNLSVPAQIKLVLLACLKTRLKDTALHNTRANFYLLAPILLLGLADQSKPVRKAFVGLLALVRDQSNALNAGSPKKVQCDLFMETQIYGDTEPSKRSIISPQDGNSMLNVLFDDQSTFDDVMVDASRLRVAIFDTLFKSTRSGKSFGLLVKTFVLNQWSLPIWPVTLKARAWAIVGAENVFRNGSEDRFVFVDDVKQYFDRRNFWIDSAAAAGMSFEEYVEVPLVNLVGGHTKNEKKTAKEIEWFLKALSTDGRLQVVANNRLVALFPTLKSDEFKLRICSELIDLVVAESDLVLQFDPVDTLQTFEFLKQCMVALLASVNIVTQVPEQGVAKRRRRSSSSTQKNMARDDISTMASVHLRRLSVILDVLENHLRTKTQELASPELLQALFKILTDLDYLGNDGKMPVLYAQETLASCMLLSIVQIKGSSKRRTKFDSNSIRADLIVNSIRLSQSPQVQNRLLLVIAELAALAPEIILHSVMPIFTFMGAHTIRQDDEFSSSALQQTILKVIPAITSASDSVSNEIEFLLTSFFSAFQHIPRHRRVKLFVSLIRTLGCEQSLHTILFLTSQQYVVNSAKGRTLECNSLLDFVTALMKIFLAHECLESIVNFYSLWKLLPLAELDSDSPEYAELSSRSIYGSGIVNLSTKELLHRKAGSLEFLNLVLSADEDSALATNSVSLKMRVSLVLFDDHVAEDEKLQVLLSFNEATSFILASLDVFSHPQIVAALYDLLKSLLNLLPLSYFVSSILASLKNVSDPVSVKIARNFAVLAGTKLDTEFNANTLDENVDAIVLDELVPILVEGIENYSDVELVQAYLDTYATIVNKYGASADLASSGYAKFLLGSLKVLTSEKCLLGGQTEVVVSSLSAITSITNVLGVKSIGYFPKILAPSLSILEATFKEGEASDSESESDSESDDEAESESEGRMLVQGAVLMLLASLVKRMPAFVVSSLKQILQGIFHSDLIDNSIRSGVLNLAIEHLDKAQMLQALCNLALTENIYSLDSAADLGLYLNCVKSTIDAIDKKSAIAQSSLFMKWLIKSFGFRTEYEHKFSDNTVHSIEASFHQCGLAYVMKLNDKSFRPLFASLVRWAVSGEGLVVEASEVSRLTAFFKFFNKLQDNLKSIVTSYFSYLLDPTIALLKRFEDSSLKETNLRRLMLHGLGSSFKYDQDDYWSHQLRFETMVAPLLGQLANIEPSIGKHLVKTISFFVSNVSSEEYNETLVRTLTRYVSNEFDNTLNTKIWTIRVLKAVFQKMGEQWLSYLPTFIPYIAELLEDDDEEVEMEVRKDLVRVIEGILGEPLDRYLN